MLDLRTRLERCFLTAFPSLTADEAPRAALGEVAGWDSLGTLTIVALVEEEFGLQVPTEELARFISFAQILDYLSGRFRQAA